MKGDLTPYQAIIELHQQGYAQDFQLSKDGLYWLQEKRAIRVGEFLIREQHCITAARSSVIILGIVTVTDEVKGILIIHEVACNSVIKNMEAVGIYARPCLSTEQFSKKDLKKRLACIMLLYMEDGLNKRKKEHLRLYLDKKLDTMVDYYRRLTRKKSKHIFLFTVAQ